MQSGISASQELLSAFNDLVSNPSQRGLLATISNESLTPGAVLPSSSDSFKSDLAQLSTHLSPTAAAYILLKQHPGEPDGFVAVTYVPNAAPVRQKMLFASTRLTLVRELGVERFRETVFVTEMQELTAEGWEKHEKHTKLDAPLTKEEEDLKGIKDAEAEESRGTGARASHVGNFDIKMDGSVSPALEGLKEGRGGSVVVIKIDTAKEELQLDSKHEDVSPAQLSSVISSDEPRFTLYKYPSNDRIVMIYTCPTSSKLRERMIYATFTRMIVKAAEGEAGLEIAKRMEGTNPDEFTEEVLAKEFEEKKEESRGFARPKRPGRR